MTTREHLPDLTLTGRFARGEERVYRHESFFVPDGVRQLQIVIDYDERIGADPLQRNGNTLDIGLFDSRGTVAGGPGFRGWSGSEQLTVTIDETWATPPYRPGAIDPGEWNLLLGPYKIGPNGLTWRARIWFDAGIAPDLPPLVRRRPAVRGVVPRAAEPGWVRGELHCHTLFSDGDSWPEEIVYAAAELGLDFIAITDHNSAQQLLPPDDPDSVLPLLVPGIEVTTYNGHWNVWGVRGDPRAPIWFDFRDPSDAVMRAEMARAAALGGLISVNHPKPWGPEWTYGDVGGAVAIEVWNGPWERLNVIALAAWDERLLAGERPVAVGGSDTHIIRTEEETAPGLRPPKLGEPTIWVPIEGPLTVESLLAGLRAGRGFLSVSPAGPQLYLERAANGDLAIRVVDAHAVAAAVGCVDPTLELIADAEVIARLPLPPGTDDWRTSVAWPVVTRYVRAQVIATRTTTGATEMLALSNPLWPD